MPRIWSWLDCISFYTLLVTSTVNYKYSRHTTAVVRFHRRKVRLFPVLFHPERVNMEPIALENWADRSRVLGCTGSNAPPKTHTKRAHHAVTHVVLPVMWTISGTVSGALRQTLKEIARTYRKYWQFVLKGAQVFEVFTSCCFFCIPPSTTPAGL